MIDIDRQICANAWTSDEAMVNHRELCLQYRGRFSASSDAAGAAAFIEKTLNRYGLTNARREYFEMTAWTRGGKAVLELVEPHRARFPCIALPYSPSCNDEFDVADGGMGHPADLAEIPGGVLGKAVLIDDKNPPAGPHLHRLHKYLNTRHAGASAFLFVQNSPGMLSPTGSLAFNHSGPLDQTIPSVGIPSEIAAELREWARRGTLRIRLTMDNSLARGRDCNVVADLGNPGTSEDIILVCAHYDGHDIAQGAVDNASGTVVVLETARLLAPLTNQLRASLRFVLFGSEEMGLIGSHSLARAMEHDLHRIRFIFNLDCVGSTGRLVMMLQNCPEWLPFFKTHIASLPADVDINTHFVPFSDHFPFVVRGIPASFMVTPGIGDRGWGHTIADTFEKVSQETLMRVSMHTARLIMRTSRLTPWPQSKKSREDIIALLESRHMRPLMEHEGHWDF
ncbi:M28 family peptidase [bacterium]|nr:M28 family peptidase [candidate division CSSED10-310 bacterium]